MNRLSPDQILTRLSIKTARKNAAQGLKVGGQWGIEEATGRLMVRLFGGAWHAPARGEVERAAQFLIWQSRTVLTPTDEPVGPWRTSTHRLSSRSA